jgi:hypothetical protein
MGPQDRPLKTDFCYRMKQMKLSHLEYLKKFLNWLQNGAAKLEASAGSCPT